MKLTTLFFVISLESIAAHGYSQTENVTVKMKDSNLKEFFNTIEKQTSYKFLYRDDAVEGISVNIDETNKPLDNILNEIFNGSGFSYKLMPNNLIVVASLEFLQQKTIVGTITDKETGEALTGVSVSLKGTTSGTLTDLNGKYTLTVLDPANATLVFSFVGYSRQEVAVAGQSTVNYALTAEMLGLDEVVVIGYGVAKKSDLTGSISSLKNDEYRDQPVTRIDQILQGRTAGVNVTNSSGAPGGTSSIRIRGSNSITGNNDPLYVIDGFVGGNFQNVNPTDIESIQVLKDASSTAVYGSRGANGVVLITTKSGVSGKPKLSFTSRFVTSKVAKTWDLMDAGDFAQTVNERADALGSAHTFTDTQIADFRKNGGTDWQNEILRTGNGQEHQLDYSGGSDDVTYFISGNYLNQDGILINSNFKRYSLRTNIDAKLSKKLKASLKVNFSRRVNDNTEGNYNTSGPLGEASRWAPTTPAYDMLGNLTVRDPVSSLYTNPIEVALNDNIYESNSFETNGGFVYQIAKGLTFNESFGASYNNIQGKTYSRNSQSGSAAAARNSNERIFLQNTNNLTYEKTFNAIHKITATAVAEYQVQQNSYFNANVTGLLFPFLKYENLTLANTVAADASKSKQTIGSYIGRVSYSLKDRYLATVSVRNDRSSKFRGANQKSTFPSIGLGWRISEEDFMKGLGFLDNLKLRASWGQTGSQAVDVYGTVTSYNTDAGNAGVSFQNGTLTSGINIGNPGNLNLKWETTTQSNIGFDLGVLKNRLTLEADYFVKNTKDLLLSEPLPGYVGGGSIYRNLGEIKNSGYEFSLKGVVINKKDFSWTIDFNISILQNKIISLGDRDYILQSGGAGAGMLSFPEMILMPGHSLSSYYGYKSLGIWQVSEAATAALYGNAPGDYKYEDLNGDHAITGDDFQIIGSGIPTKMIGFNSTINYKGFTLNAFFQSMLGFDKWDFAYAQTMITAADARETTHADILERWTPEHPDRLVAAFSKTNRPQIQSSAYVEKGNYLRLKNLSLQYVLPRSVLKWADIAFQISGQNIWTLTKYKGLDPEAYSNVGPTDQRGGDGGAYPNAKTWTFGITLNY